MSSPILEIQNLSIQFDGQNHKVIDDVSLELKKGESLGIVGESGSGKSLTCMAILQILPKNAEIISGKINFISEETLDLNLLEDKELRAIRGKKISMIFQEPMTALNPSFTCGNQLDEVLKIHTRLNKAERKTRILECFEEVQLPEPKTVFKKYPHELSGGQQQRVMIAMAIINRPDILIADEPTTALDVTVQKHILNLLKDLQKKHQMSLIFVSHDLGVIKNISDKVVIMYQGKIVESGNAKEVFQNPKHAYTKGLINCIPPIENRPKILPVIQNFIDSDEVVIENETKEERQKKQDAIYKNDAILEIKNLEVWFPKHQNILGKTKLFQKAVNNISFSLYKGETLGLVGESGCGKTTVGRSIMNLIAIKSGAIHYDDKTINNLDKAALKKIRQKIQLIFQDPYSSLNPRITIGQSIMEPMIVHNIGKNNAERRNRVNELLEQTGLNPEHFNRFPHEFSGGQRQRVGIARALALEPEILICDESVSALDVSVQAQVLNLLNDLKHKYNLTYLFISHDLSVVKYMSDRVIVMNRGKMEEINEADALYHQPQKAYTKKLIDSILD